MAHLIATFIQTAANTRFDLSLYHFWLYKFHVLGDTDLPDPGFTQYYDKKVCEGKDATQPYQHEYERVVQGIAGDQFNQERA